MAPFKKTTRTQPKALDRKERGGGDAPEGKKDEPIKRVVIVPIGFETRTITIAGESPLLVHAWSEKAQRMIEEKQQKIIGVNEQGSRRAKREQRDPDAEVEAAYYRTKDGRLGFPARAIKCACIEAAPLAGLTKKIVMAGFHIMGPDILPLTFEKKPYKRADMVRLGGISRTADIRYRPEFPDWKMSLPVKINTALFTWNEVYDLLNWAGSAIGVGEWRTAKSGVHGQFGVVVA